LVHHTNATAKPFGLARSEDEILAAYRSVVEDPEGEHILKRLEQFGIDAAVILMVDNPSYDWTDHDLLRAIEALGSLGEKYPGKIIPFAGINPTRKNAPSILREAVNTYNIRGVKWHPDIAYFWPNEEKAYALLGAAEELDVPILTHTGHLPAPSKSKYSHPMLYDDVLVDFPNLKMIAAHMGFRWWKEWAAIAEFKPNFFGDLSEWQFIATTQFKSFCQTLREAIDIVGVENFLFGTDSPVFDEFISVPDWIDLLRNLPLNAPEGIQFTENEITLILGGNAKRLLGSTAFNHTED
jgi:predicted TIM-barrel fold metal-dependent hydrolase